MGLSQSSSAKHLANHIEKKRLVMETTPLWDSEVGLDSPERYFIACAGKSKVDHEGENSDLFAVKVTTGNHGVVFALASQLVVPKNPRWTADPEAVLFDDSGPHFPSTPECPTAVWLSCPDKWGRDWCGPRFGGTDVKQRDGPVALYAGSLVPQTISHMQSRAAVGVTDNPCAVANPSFPTWKGLLSTNPKDVLKVTRLHIFRIRTFRLNYY